MTPAPPGPRANLLDSVPAMSLLANERVSKARSKRSGANFQPICAASESNCNGLSATIPGSSIATLGESCERRELDRIGVQVPPGRRPMHPKIGGRDDDPGRGSERELAAEDFELLPVALAPAQPPAQVIELQERSVLGDATRNPGKRDVGRELAGGLAAEIQPQAHPALARAYVERIVDPAPPRDEIGVFELGVDLPDTRARISGIQTVQITAHIER